MKSSAHKQRSRKPHLFRSAKSSRSRDERPFFTGNSKSSTQSKLNVSRPGDQQEKEAEATADRVTKKLGVAFFPGPVSEPEQEKKSPALMSSVMPRSKKTPLVNTEIKRTSSKSDGKEKDDVQRSVEQETVSKQENNEQEDKSIQRKAEGEEDVAKKEDLNQPRAQLQGEKEESVAAKAEPNSKDEVQAQPQEEESVQAKAELDSKDEVKKQPEDESVQAKAEPDSKNEVQTQSEEEEPIQAKAEKETQSDQVEEEETSVQRQAEGKEEEQEEIQRRALVPPQENAELHGRLMQSKGRGEPLPTNVAMRFGQAFGNDFSAVRIHTSSEAASLSKDFGAQAFTHGKDIYFSQGRFSPDSAEGRHLLAHELTHSIQQGVAPRVSPSVDADLQRDTNDDLAAELRASEQESVQAIDPVPAEQARREAEQEGQLALKNAQEQLPQAQPELPPPPPIVDATAGKVAEAESRRPDYMAPKPAPEEQGDTGAFLAEESAGVCGQGAAKSQKLADNQSAHDSAEDKRDQSDASVVPPTEEGASLSNAEQVSTMDAGAAPKTDPGAAKKALEQGVKEATPSSIKGLNEFKSEGKGKVVGNEVAAQVTSDVNKVKGTYSAIETPPPPVPADTPETLPAPELAPETARLNLGKNAVPPLAEEHTDFSGYQKESDALLEKEGISQSQLDMVDSGELAEANQERKQLSKDVTDQPAAVQQFAQEETEQVDRDLVQEEGKVREATRAKRDQDLNSTGSRQQQVKSELELKRENVTKKVNGIYEAAKKSVTKKLENLEKVALKRFDDGQARYAVQFEVEVDSDIEDWKDDRYSGLFAGVKWLKDKLVGIDHFPEVKRAFDRGRARFVKRLDQLMLDINRDNDKVIQECRDELKQARKDIKAFVDKLGPELKDAGLKAQTDMQAKLKELDGFIDKKKKELQEKLCEAKDAAIEAIDKKIEEMKASMSGVVGKLGALLLKAALKFFEWALEKAGLNSGELMKIINKGVSVIKVIVGDPIQFFKNMAAAVGAGIQGFVTRIKKYLIQGLIEWLTGSLGEAGITLPKKFDLAGIMSLVLQILGLTWANIRQKLVKKLGEKVVAGLEKTSEVVKRVIKDGPMALWDMIKEKAAEIKQKVMDGIRNWVILNVVKQAVFKLLSMLNPAGAIVQAVIAIYNVVMFFVENISRIIDFAKSIINSVTKIASGAISSAAGFIEKALGRTVPIILAFLARLIGLGGVGKAVKNVINTVRKPVDKVLDKVVGFVAKNAQKVIGKVKGAAGKVKGAAKKAVGKLKGWWQQKVELNLKSGKKHTIKFKGKGSGAKLIIKSTPTEFKNFLNKQETEINKQKGKSPERTQELLKSFRELKEKYREIEKAIDKRKKEKKNEGQIPGLSDLKKRAKKLLDEIEENSELDLEESKLVPHGQTAGFGNKVTAEPLTRKGKPGGSPSVKGGHWGQLLKRRKGGSSYYVRGHLINDNVHGPGNTWNNLSPITREANSLHESSVESEVKKAVDKGETLSYEVEAKYAIGLKSGLLDKVQTDSDPEATPTVKTLRREVITAEQYLPTKFVCIVKKLDKTKQPAAYKSWITKPVDNKPKQDLPSDYEVDGAGAVSYTLKKLNLQSPIPSGFTGDKKAISLEAYKLLPGIGEARAPLLYEARARLVSKIEVEKVLEENKIPKDLIKQWGIAKYSGETQWDPPRTS